MFARKWKKENNRLNRRNEALKAENEALNQILDDTNEEYRKMQLQLWDMEGRMEQERQDGRKRENRLKSELWRKVHEILTDKEAGKGFEAGVRRGCFLNQDGTWTVVVDNGQQDGAGPAVFHNPEDAYCYYALYQVFGMRPDVRASMEGYLASFRKSA